MRTKKVRATVEFPGGHQSVIATVAADATEDEIEEMARDWAFEIVGFAFCPVSQDDINKTLSEGADEEDWTE